MSTGLCFYSEDGMITTMQDVLDEATPIWEEEPSLGMCYAVIVLRREGKLSRELANAVMAELVRYTDEISPYHVSLQAALTERYGDEGFDYYFEVFKDWESRRRPTRWQNFWYRLKRIFL